MSSSSASSTILPTRDVRSVQGQRRLAHGERLHTSAIPTLGQALLSTGFPADLRGNEKALDWWRHFSFQTQALRRTGSTALNLGLCRRRPL